MNQILSATAALGLLGAATLVAAGLNVDNPPDATGGDFTLSAARAETPGRFRLVIAGHDVTCLVSKEKSAATAATELEIAGECLALLPRLAEVRYWRETDDGTVVFAGADGEALVEFFGADGVAYESLRPAAPFISMIATN